MDIRFRRLGKHACYVHQVVHQCSLVGFAAQFGKCGAGECTPTVPTQPNLIASYLVQTAIEPTHRPPYARYALSAKEAVAAHRQMIERSDNWEKDPYSSRSRSRSILSPLSTVKKKKTYKSRILNPFTSVFAVSFTSPCLLHFGCSYCYSRRASIKSSRTPGRSSNRSCQLNTSAGAE